MTAEEFFVQFLSARLTVPVLGDIPSPMPQRFVTVEQLGSRSQDKLYHPRIAVQSWAESRAEAAKLNELVKQAMTHAAESAAVSSCKLESDYNFPELDLKAPRYQAIFELTYLG